MPKRPSDERHKIANVISELNGLLYTQTCQARLALNPDTKSGKVDAYLLTAYDCINAAQGLMIEECVSKAELDEAMK